MPFSNDYEQVNVCCAETSINMAKSAEIEVVIIVFCIEVSNIAFQIIKK